MRKTLLIFLIFLFIPCFSLAEDVSGFSDFSASFPDQFLVPGEAPLVTENSYASPNISLTISVSRVNRSDVYVADIYVRTPECLQRAFGGQKWSTTMQKVKTIAESSGALLAMTGDNGHNFKSGWVFANGEIKRKSSNKTRDLCLIYKTGEMVTIKGSKIDDKEIADNADNIWQSFLFGPALLNDGEAVSKFSSTLSSANPRSAIGYFEPGHYCFVQVDGRGTASAVDAGVKNVGMTLPQLSQFMADLGCKTAYNLDGGQSSLLWFGGAVVSTPYKGGRSIGDVVILKELEGN